MKIRFSIKKYRHCNRCTNGRNHCRRNHRSKELFRKHQDTRLQGHARAQVHDGGPGAEGRGQDPAAAAANAEAVPGQPDADNGWRSWWTQTLRADAREKRLSQNDDG